MPPFVPVKNRLDIVLGISCQYHFIEMIRHNIERGVLTVSCLGSGFRILRIVTCVKKWIIYKRER